ncbi:MAG: YgjV family protein [Clostridia bacterium]|nr:YgjV family protein [Clostridia bacterium]
MEYYIAQFFGILVTAGVIINQQLKKKKQMLILSVFVNLFSAANILLLDGFNSGVVVCLVAVFQLIFSIWHEFKGTQPGTVEKIIFLILYAGGGIIGIKAPIDLLSTFAALFYMLAVFQKKEQRIRMFLLVNLSTWTVYHGILGSTAVFAQIAGIISSLIALYRFRNSEKEIKNEKES